MTRRPRQRYNQLVVFQLIIMESSWFLRGNILQTWALLTDIDIRLKCLNIVSNNLSFPPFYDAEMHRKLWSEAPAKECALDQIFKKIQVLHTHINFLRNRTKKIYNRAKELYCDATIFVFQFFIVYLSKKKKKKWKMKNDFSMEFTCRILAWFGFLVKFNEIHCRNLFDEKFEINGSSYLRVTSLSCL